MAYITPVHGTAQPVFHVDAVNGSVAGSANLSLQPVANPAGPKLDFFALTANADISTSGNTWQYVGNVLNAVQQIGTVAFYQVSGATLNIALFPAGIPSATVVAAAQSANAAIGIPTANIASSATFETR